MPSTPILNYTILPAYEVLYRYGRQRLAYLAEIIFWTPGEYYFRASFIYDTFDTSKDSREKRIVEQILRFIIETHLDFTAKFVPGKFFAKYGPAGLYFGGPSFV